MFREFAGCDFELIGQIDPVRNQDGLIEEFLPQSRYRNAATARLHAYGAGPFCRFVIAKGRRQSGLYVITKDGEAAYAGECENLEKRYSANGYGGISPRNCFEGGQPTNCRVNALILEATLSGKLIELWFHVLREEKNHRRDAETDLIHALRPAWNKAKLGRR